MMRPTNRSTAGSRRSYRPQYTDDIDAITPCPPAPAAAAAAVAAVAPATPSEPSSSRSSCSLDSAMREADRSPSPSSLSDAMSAIQVGAFRNRRRDSVRALEEGTNGDPERLWKRMLALQQIYGCYRSARMSAALESGDISSLLPSKTCLDLLNDNMDVLPDDAEEVLKKTPFLDRFRRKRSSN